MTFFLVDDLDFLLLEVEEEGEVTFTTAFLAFLAMFLTRLIACLDSSWSEQIQEK